MELSTEEKRAMIEKDDAKVSIRRQCELLSLHRSNWYYTSAAQSEENILLMKLLDEEYTRHPFKGIRRMTQYLKDCGYEVNRKRVSRLLKLLGLEAIYPKKKNLSKSHSEHQKYPYLLRDLVIDHPNQVWCVDVTYIRLRQGFVYLVAIMDWHSRYVLSWRLSNSLDSAFCVEALEDALMFYGFPDIFNSDQGSQFTSEAFTKLLKANKIAISMDGRGRAFDNIFIERLWRSVKYEEVYLHDYEGITEAKKSLERYFKFYNYERHHQSLNYKKPAEIYFGEKWCSDQNTIRNLLIPHEINYGVSTDLLLQ